MRHVWLWLLVIATLGTCHGAPREIVIFHTNDIHGHFTAEPAGRGGDHALIGGIDALSYDLDSLRHVYPHSLYVDAGDLMTGNPVCNIVYRGVKGGALQEMLHRCGIAAECLGNHEFDLGARHLREWIAASPYPVLCANLRDQSSDTLVTAAARMVNVNGVRVGLVGVLLDDLAGEVSSEALRPFVVDDAAASAQREIERLDPSTDLIVILSHMGVEADSLMATKLHHADVIVGGHSHTRLEKPKRVNGIIIVQAGSYLKDLGVLRLQVEGDSVVSDSGFLVELRQPRNPPHNDAVRLADSLQTVIQSEYGQVIGYLQTAWRSSYYTGSNVGNWICDRLRARYQADVAFVNAGGIRGEIQRGPVTKLAVLQLLPFTNSVVLFDATPGDLRTLADEQARAQGLHTHGVLEMSGMKVTFSAHDSVVTVKNIEVDGKPLDENRSYRIVSIDYVAISQWNRHLGFKPHAVDTTGELLSDVIMDEIAKISAPIGSDDAPRLVEVP
jgi:2',3'-cyclic-nucleotide 2'-phosphodiesterase (5'-nucleotidase family)